MKGYRQVQQEVHVKQVSVHNSLLIGKPELPPSGDGGDLDNGRSETVIIWLGCEVGASRTTAIAILLVWGGASVSLIPEV